MTVAQATGPEGCYEVVHERVAVRSKPAMTAPLRGALPRGRAVRGRPHLVEGEPWLRLCRAPELGPKGTGGWALIHGRHVGLGELLRPAAAIDEERHLVAPHAGGDPTGEPEQLVAEGISGGDPGLAAEAGRLAVPLGAPAARAPSFVEAEGVLEAASPGPGGAAGESGLEPALPVVVKAAASGEALATLGLRATATARDVKRALAAGHGEYLHAQRLLLGARLLEDDERLEALPAPLEVQLLRLPFVRAAGEELLQHAGAGDPDGVLKALKAPASPDYARDVDGHTPLIAAVGSTGSPEMVVQLLCDALADPQKANAAGATPMHLAAQRGSTMMATYLRRRGALLDPRTQGGATPLHLAAHQGHGELVRHLCLWRAEADAVNHSGASPLYLASQAGSLATVRGLCEAGACLNLAKQGGATPAHIAAQKGHADVVQHLCEAGADKDAALGEACETFAGADKPLLDGATPLLLAAYMGHIEVVQCLFLAGADKEVESSHGFTAFQVAAKRRHQEVVQVLSVTHAW